MKYHYTLIYPAVFGAIILSVSCMKTETVTRDGDDAGIISFSTGVESRAVVDEALDISSFKVWGFYSNPAETGPFTTVFDAETVTGSGSGWSYDNPKYWIADMEYDFYAIYPDNVLKQTGLVDEEDGTRPYLGIATYDAANNGHGEDASDLMMAVSKSVVYDPDLGTPDAVALTFHHLLSRVGFLCRADEASVGVAGFEPVVYKASLYGLYEQGSYSSENFDPDDRSSIRLGWKVPDTSGEVITGKDSPYVETDYGDDGYPIPEDALTETGLLEDVMVFPQQLPQSVYFSISYSTDGGQTRTERDIQLISMPLSVWEAGMQYRYTFTLSAGGRIYFDVPSVNEWSDASGGIIIVE